MCLNFSFEGFYFKLKHVAMLVFPYVSRMSCVRLIQVFSLCYIQNVRFKTKVITYRSNLCVSLYLRYFIYVIYCKLNTDLNIVITIPVGIDVTLCNCVFEGKDSRSVNFRNQNPGLCEYNSLASL